MENFGDDWHRITAKRIGEAVAARRVALGLTAQRLAERCRDLGAPIHRTTITKIENGRPRFDLGELVVLAAALDTSPLALMYGSQLADGEIEVLPGLSESAAEALLWHSGMGEAVAHDRESYWRANEPIAMTYSRYSMEQTRKRLGKDDMKMLEFLTRQSQQLNDQMRAAGLIVKDGEGLSDG